MIKANEFYEGLYKVAVKVNRLSPSYKELSPELRLIADICVSLKLLRILTEVHN